MKRNFPKDTKMANKYIKRCSISLAIKRNANQNHNQILLHPTRMTIILKRQTIPSADKDMKKLKPHTLITDNVDNIF